MVALEEDSTDHKSQYASGYHECEQMRTNTEGNPSSSCYLLRYFSLDHSNGCINRHYHSQLMWLIKMSKYNTYVLTTVASFNGAENELI